MKMSGVFEKMAYMSGLSKIISFLYYNFSENFDILIYTFDHSKT